MIPYIIYSALILSGCLIFYKLLLQNETFFKANRVVLLVCLLLAFILPLVKVPQQLSFRKTETRTVIYPQLVDDQFSVPAQKEISMPINSSSTQKHFVTFSEVKTWLIWLYWFGVMAFALNFLIQLSTLLYQAHSKPMIKDSRYRIVEISGDKAPSSFGNNIFINPEKYDWDTYNQILLHEKIHVRQKHTIDLIVTEIVLVFQWFNPFAWIYRKAVENNLEFLTDSSLLKSTAVKKQDYQISLLKVSAPQFPLSLTTNYNQSLLKKRIFMMNTKQSNLHTAWKYFFIIPMMVLFVSLFNDPVANAQSSEQKESKRNVNNKGLSTEGSWFATIKDDKIHIEFKSDESEYSTNSTTFSLSDFKDLPRDKQGAFSLTREAGTMNFTGKFEGDQGMGQYKFSPSNDFTSFLKKEGIDETTDRDLMAYFLVDVRQSYVQMLKQNGYTKLDRNDLLPLAALDVNEEYIKSIKNAGFSDIKIRDLIPLRALHVDAAYISEIRKAGYSDVSIQKIISFKAQGIDAKYIADIRSSVKVDPTESDRKQNPDENATNEKIKEESDKLKDKSNKKSADEFGDISSFKALNIDADYISSIKSAGFPDVTSRELVGMKANNVTKDYINSIKGAGFPDVSAHNIISAKATGIDAGLIKEYKELGFETLTLNNIIAAKSTGTTPAFIAAMKQKGHDMKSINKYIMLKTAITEN